jgi:hypothetical protein
MTSAPADWMKSCLAITAVPLTTRGRKKKGEKKGKKETGERQKKKKRLTKTHLQPKETPPAGGLCFLWKHNT